MKRVRYYALLFTILAMNMKAVFAEATFVIKFSHVNGPNSLKGMAAEHFKKQAEEITDNKVRVDVFTDDGPMHEDNVAIEALQLGAIHMLAPSTAKISTLGLPEFEIFDLPYFFPDTNAVHRITGGPIGEDLLSKLQKKGIVGLGFWDNGFKSMFANRPVPFPTDMGGLRMRTDPSGVLANQMTTLGAQACHLTFSDTIDLMQKNMIDGVESTPVNLALPQFDRAPKYLTVTNHGYLGYAVIMNKKFWDNLPTKIRGQLIHAVNLTAEFANELAQKQNQANLEAMKESKKINVYELTNDQKTLWRNALASLPTSQKTEQRIGKELIAEVNLAIGRSGE